jgi:hypothetical protein
MNKLKPEKEFYTRMRTTWGAGDGGPGLGEEFG